MNVYIVTDGDYSDYRILGVFTDKEAAEKFALGQALAEGRNYHGELNIEVWKADEPQAQHVPYAYDIDAVKWRINPAARRAELYED